MACVKCGREENDFFVRKSTIKMIDPTYTAINIMSENLSTKCRQITIASPSKITNSKNKIASTPSRNSSQHQGLFPSLLGKGLST